MNYGGDIIQVITGGLCRGELWLTEFKDESSAMKWSFQIFSDYDVNNIAYHILSPTWVLSGLGH